MFNQMCRDAALRIGGLAVFAVLGATSAPLVLAEAMVIEEVVVTAQKRQQSQQDVPISINAYSAGAIEKLGAGTFTDLTASAPNVNMGRADRASRGQITIRGIGDYSRSVGQDARAGMYIDGVYVGRSYASNPDLEGIEVLEILRGPQGTLFGKNTVSGAVNITTRKPTQEFEGTVKADIGNYEYRKLSAYLSGPLSDTVAASLSIVDVERDGHVKNVLNGKYLNGEDRYSVRGRLIADVSDQLSIDVRAEILKSDVDATSNEAVAPGGLGNPFPIQPQPYKVSHDFPESEDREIKSFAVTADYELANEFMLTYIGAYSEADYNNFDEEDFGPDFAASFHAQEEMEMVTHELRLASPANAEYDYLVGLYYYDQDLESVTGAQLNGGAIGLFGVIDVMRPAQTSGDSFAVYFHGNWSITENLQLTGGGRWQRESKDIDYQMIDTSNILYQGVIPGLGPNTDGILFCNCADSGDRSASNFSPKIGLNYFVNDDTMIFGSYSVAYKSGGFNADWQDSAATLAAWEFDDEKVGTFELGIKTDLLEKRLRINANIFRSKFTDFQVQQFVPSFNQQTQTQTFIAAIENAGEVVSQGVELNLTALLMDNLQVNLNASYTDAEFDKFDNAAPNGAGGFLDYSGTKLPFAPELNFFVAIDYTLPMGEADLVFHVDYSKTDDMFSETGEAPGNFMDTQDVLNANITYANEDWQVTAYAKNLSDSDDIKIQTINFFGIPRGVYQMRRQYGLRFSYHF